MLRLVREMDANLIENCRRGDPGAQRALFNLFSPQMLAVCRRYLSNRTEAEEVLIAGFLSVFSRIGQFRHEGSFEGWVRKIMVNEALGFLRKKRSLFLFSELDGAVGVEEPVLPDTALQIEELLEMVASLPDGYRTVFNLYAIEGYTHREIAEMLEIKESTSKSQLSRARDLLRQRLERVEKKINKKAVPNGKSD